MVFDYKIGDEVKILENLKEILDDVYLFNSYDSNERKGKTGIVSEILPYPQGKYYHIEVTNKKLVQRQVKSINRKKVVIVEEETGGDNSKKKNTKKYGSPEECLILASDFNLISFVMTMNFFLSYRDDYVIIKKSKKEYQIITDNKEIDKNFITKSINQQLKDKRSTIQIFF